MTRSADPARGEEQTRAFGRVTVHVAANGGTYPYGNSMTVHGANGTLLVDPSLALQDDPVGADVVFASHAHEDHLAGLRHFPDTDVAAHRLDAPAVRSAATMLDGYGLDPQVRAEFERELTETFALGDRSEVTDVLDGHVFDLGGAVRATVIHLPGHTAGHCGLLVEPDGYFYVGDIDLTGFGPYYGDIGSSLTDFQKSIAAAAAIESRWYGTFHQKGTVTGHEEFVRRAGIYASVIAERTDKLLNFLGEPHTLADIVEHRLVYRPHVHSPYVDAVERRTAEQHLEQLMEAGEIVCDEHGFYCRT
ncbi:MBL fold metallo-hydrolase [Gordonia polyisoprenivorans]|uniref:MBL fold metallo-hydrolase n=1 Tax=Gordonia polyisoprenivorans TaxID=84595 RepID=UPI001AD66D02|nr:MBL fold metallo-hydrolase [Gordonia polyisoprenivorans]QTI69008.1 MBL fold metallo-hydrolase [Gordonia polyisoprenivorans]